MNQPSLSRAIINQYVQANTTPGPAWDNQLLQFFRVAMTEQETFEKTLQRAVLIVSLTLETY